MRMTKETTLELLAELLEGFSDSAFQRKLRDLSVRQRMKGHHGLECAEGRAALALQVQRAVLPRYGFEGSLEGVAQMKAVVQKFRAHDDVRAAADAVRDKISAPGPRSPVPEDAHKEETRKRLAAEMQALRLKLAAAENKLAEIDVDKTVTRKNMDRWQRQASW